MAIGLIILQTLYFLLPAYFANMTPVFARRLPFSWIAKPIDGGRTIDGEPILGKNKTWGGLVIGIAVGTALFSLQKLLFEYSFFENISLFDYSEMSIWLGVFLGGGALVGDATKSFLKRRVGIAPGKSWIPFDQMDYTIGALILSAIIYVPPIEIILTSIVVSPFLHVGFNFIGYVLKLQKNKL